MKSDFFLDVGRYLYDTTIRTTHVPRLEEVSSALNLPPDRVEAAFAKLGRERALVRQKTSGEVLMLPPFSAVPTTFHVRSGDRWWWANCIWDALGIPVMIEDDAFVTTTCPCCGDELTVSVRNGSLEAVMGVPHYALPLKQWWEDVFFA